MDKVPSIGRIVHYILPAGPSQGQHRPGIVTHLWNKDTQLIHLQVFLDTDRNGQYNDGLGVGQLLWATSVRPDQTAQTPGTWHWPEDVINAEYNETISAMMGRL